MNKVPAYLMVCFASVALGPNLLKSAPGSSTNEALYSLINAPFEQFSGEIASKDFFVRLPAHVSIRSGSEMNLVVRHSPQLRMSAIMISVNGQKLSTNNIDVRDGAAATNAFITLRTPVPPEVLNAGWNRISLEWSSAANRAPFQSALWSIWRFDSHLKVAYERLPLFPELARFPQSIAEEELLQRGSTSLDVSSPVALLLPAQRRDVHLRSVAVLGARLGQVGYLSDDGCRVGLIADGQKHLAEHNGIIVARWDELSDFPLRTNVAEAATSLKEGQGLLAEFIVGNQPDQRRWVLATGHDDGGVEKAVLTLGSALALASAPPSPAVIEVEPKLPEKSRMQEAGEQKITLNDIGWREVHLRGRQSEKSISGWWLPAGVEVASGSFLELHLNHSRGLTNSNLEVLVNGVRAAIVPLNDENASAANVKVPLPEKLPSRDPMIVTLHALLETGREGGTREEEAWVTISGDSTLETTTEPVRITGVHQVHQLLVRDNSLRKSAFLVPYESSLEELQVLLSLSMHLGKQLPSSPALRPEACAYSASAAPQASRIKDRSVLVLGPVHQWKAALPPGTRLAIGPPDGNPDIIRIQGRRYKLSAFDPSIVVMQMLPSPWSAEETLVTVGGWKDFASPTVKRMLTEAAPAGRIYGNLSAMDAAGRAVAYDTRRPSVESFAERIHRRMPLGLNSEDTARKLQDGEDRFQRSAFWNDLVFYVAGALLLFFITIRLLLLWDRDRSRRKSIRGEKPLGSAP